MINLKFEVSPKLSFLETNCFVSQKSRAHTGVPRLCAAPLAHKGKPLTAVVPCSATARGERAVVVLGSAQAQ